MVAKKICWNKRWSSTQLDSLRLPNNLDSIAKYAFMYCDSLKSISIPTSVTKIELEAFMFLDNLYEITVDANNHNYKDSSGVLFTKDMRLLHSYPNMKEQLYTVPQGVEIIGKSAFNQCNNVTEIVLPQSLLEIQEVSFAYMKNLININLHQTSVRLIDRWAFNVCEQLPEVRLPIIPSQRQLIRP